MFNEYSLKAVRTWVSYWSGTLHGRSRCLARTPLSASISHAFGLQYVRCGWDRASALARAHVFSTARQW